MQAVISAFRHFQSDISEGSDTNFKVTHITTGLAHKTYCLIHNPSGRKYIIQNLNPIFNFSALNHNLQLFEQAQKIYSEKLPDYWAKVNYLSVRNSDAIIYEDSAHQSWRVMNYVEGEIFNNFDKVTPQIRLKLADSLGQAIVTFGNIINTIPVNNWLSPLPHFHDLPYHYTYLQSVLNGQDVTLSLSQNLNVKVKLQSALYKKDNTRIKKLLTKIEARKSLVENFIEVDLVITHGDTKINNAIFRKEATGIWHCICLIDLDTIQPGDALDDLGDALRSIGNLGNENPKDINAVTIDKDIVTALLSGYFGVVTPEKLSLALKSYTKFLYMLSLRFLADYLVGSKYFSSYAGQRPDLNLYRAEVQMATLEKLESLTITI